MRITARLIVTLALTAGLVVGGATYIQLRTERGRLVEDLERRSAILAESIDTAVDPALFTRDRKKIQQFVGKFSNRGRLSGIAITDAKGDVLAATPVLQDEAATVIGLAAEALKSETPVVKFIKFKAGEQHAYTLALHSDEGVVTGSLIILQDTTHVHARLRDVWRNNFLRLLTQVFLIALVTLFVVRWDILAPVAQMAEWMRHQRAGDDSEPSPLPHTDLFGPMAKEVKTFARHLSVAKTAAEEEARLRQISESLWTPERLKDHVKMKLGGQPLVIVSNREPYMHRYKGREVEVIVPAGGVVTALDPLMRACGGTWIAHGAGDADWDFVDKRNRVRVPPEDPQYTLRRVALSAAEENGYYYGFSNEGLWPLCHIAHVRPDFRPEDWTQYLAANQKFADATLDEIEDQESPCVLVQDYHFAVLPRMIKERRPDARVALFWHIPWPNPESFGICPWQTELVSGMLGADLMGFHTQYHCNNFLETVDRTMECRIDRERFSVIKEGHLTAVKPFPISVHFPGPDRDKAGDPSVKVDKPALLKELRTKAEFLGVGVDRVDYTKGILERFRAVERFLDKHPKYRGRFTFVQLGAPSRTHIQRYNQFLAETDAEADRINWKFKASDWRPIVYLKKHHNHKEIEPYYRAADVCMVTSLSDGMNLVAKEFVAAREDDDGALVLSRFAGASRELADALIVNPYDIDQAAEAIRYALEMPAEERRTRMRRLRETVKENNIYRWAGNLITELTQIRPEPRPGVHSA
ncbi:MAG: trehalose-6-phosphate synthase [Elusimicrobia bacterium]|nr:trehalose-6-phosphate synthase [Elusimicrobiota bacterium]